MNEEKNTHTKHTHNAQNSSSETAKKKETRKRKSTRNLYSNELVRIGEVAEMFKLNTSVLRFWEVEFVELNPTRTPTGQRLYSAADVALIKKLKKLLHDEGLTIEGTKKSLRKNPLPKGAKKLKISADIPALSLYPEEKTSQVNKQTMEENTISTKNNGKISQKILRQVESQLLELQNLLSL